VVAAIVLAAIVVGAIVVARVGVVAAIVVAVIVCAVTSKGPVGALVGGFGRDLLRPAARHSL
jgi:hypothetical protein